LELSKLKTTKREQDVGKDLMESIAGKNNDSVNAEEAENTDNEGKRRVDSLFGLIKLIKERRP